MPKKLPPAPEGKILVKSEAYGDHHRSKRGTFKKAVLNDDLTLSTALNVPANAYAKAVKDALDPFRAGFADGKLWSRLLSIFKKQLRAEGVVDFGALREFECHTRYPLARILRIVIGVTASADLSTVQVQLTTNAVVKAAWEKADQYRLKLIVVFYDVDLDANVESEIFIYPLGANKWNKTAMNFSVPMKATIALIALRCDFWLKGRAVGGDGRKGMQILRVLDLRGDKTEASS